MVRLSIFGAIKFYDCYVSINFKLVAEHLIEDPMKIVSKKIVVENKIFMSFWPLKSDCRKIFTIIFKKTFPQRFRLSLSALICVCVSVHVRSIWAFTIPDWEMGNSFSTVLAFRPLCQLETWKMIKPTNRCRSTNYIEIKVEKWAANILDFSTSSFFFKKKFGRMTIFRNNEIKLDLPKKKHIIAEKVLQESRK